MSRPVARLFFFFFFFFLWGGGGGGWGCQIGQILGPFMITRGLSYNRIGFGLLFFVCVGGVSDDPPDPPPPPPSLGYGPELSVYI